MKNALIKVISLFVASILIITAVSASSFALPDDTFTYEVIGDSVNIKKCNNSVSGNLSVPSEIDGIPVRSIDDFAFCWCAGITSITIPDTVTDIGREAFFGCTSLSDITLPDSVNIGYDAFTNTGYYNNESNWDNHVLYIGKHIVSAKRGDEVLSGDYTVKSGTKTIAYGAFTRCFGLTGVSIPDSVTIIGETAFAHCTALKRIAVDDGNENYSVDAAGALYNKDKTQLLQFPAGSELDSFTIPDGVTKIGVYSFVVCKGLKEIVFPESVTEIGHNAFEECTSLTAVELPNGLNVIGSSAFANCTALTQVTLPESLKSVGSYAFAGCVGLKSVKIPSGVTEIGNYAFGYANEEEKIADFKILCIDDSAGKHYAESNGFDYEIYTVDTFLGDVNSDGNINSTDALMALQHTTGIITLTADQIRCADVTGDGNVNSSDALRILQFTTGIIESF